MSPTSVLIILSTVLYLIGLIPYLYHVFHGRVVPHPFSWTIWCVFALTNGYILIMNEGYSLSSIPVFIRAFSLLIGAILGWISISKISIGRLDITALLLAIVVIFSLRMIGMNQAIVCIILIDFLILTPTLKKLWLNPKSEDPLAWIMGWLSQMCILFTLESYSFANIGYFVYLGGINLLVAFLIYRRMLYLSNWRHALRNFYTNFALKKKL